MQRAVGSADEAAGWFRRHGVFGQPGGPPAGERFSAADLIARGVATSGVLRSVVPTGLAAGHVAGGLAPDQADDPLLQISMEYTGPAGARS